MNQFIKSKLFFWTAEVLLLVIIFYFLYQVSFIFTPVKIIFFTLFTPIVTALFLYYLCNPIVTKLGMLNIPKPLSIIAIFLSFITLIVVLVAGIIPGIVHQTTQLINSFPTIYETASQHLNVLTGGGSLESLGFQFDPDQVDFISILSSVAPGLFSGIGNIAGSLWSAGITMITTPIVLFYLFKDGSTLFEKIMTTVPRMHRSFLHNIFSSIHRTLQAYIAGQAIICLYVGLCLFVCYTIIGLPYAFLLGILAGVMDIIPYAGPWIASIPALLVAFSISPLTAIIIAIVIIIIQLGESYIVSPYVMGKSLHLHPIIVIFVLLIAGKLAGLIGMILGIPIFMMIKIILEHTIAYFAKEKSAADVPDGTI